ncbi:MAG: YqzK family protein [Bacillaceae bacterium]|nr:YqzK family protein [Bacillaceae bacterium]
MVRWFYLFKEFLKVFIIFIVCTALFYYGLRIMHEEYENFHRYDRPEGRAVKVFDQQEGNLLDRLSIFFRLGE